jgi:hypothetical protein
MLSTRGKDFLQKSGIFYWQPLAADYSKKDTGPFQ